jgi:hypothetical protein
MALSHTNPNITRPGQPSDKLLGGVTIKISFNDVKGPLPPTGLALPERPADVTFAEALEQAAEDPGTNRQAAFWEWLERTVSENLAAFNSDEVPDGIRRWAKTAKPIV